MIRLTRRATTSSTTNLSVCLLRRRTIILKYKMHPRPTQREFRRGKVREAHSSWSENWTQFSRGKTLFKSSARRVRRWQLSGNSSYYNLQKIANLVDSSWQRNIAFHSRFMKSTIKMGKWRISTLPILAIHDRVSTSVRIRNAYAK